ncbi:hypothetical protein EVAR_24195_1 [Eumeta japonica]|uniref:Uncharacterized protein n=1 Tax=Eumeta variegata TaxID=151549 RepID=A0A4C1W633_EUMVA|nr:hypothetical protein EVAR_24195_1 [Eumeta japonica]
MRSPLQCTNGGYDWDEHTEFYEIDRRLEKVETGYTVTLNSNHLSVEHASSARGCGATEHCNGRGGRTTDRLCCVLRERPRARAAPLSLHTSEANLLRVRSPNRTCGVAGPRHVCRPPAAPAGVTYQRMRTWPLGDAGDDSN